VHARNPRFPLVDSLRAIAALGVFAYHIVFHLAVAGDGQLRDYGLQLNVGVALFFVISGFLLYRPFAAARYAGDPVPPLVPYAVRRVLRIVPAYWVALPIVAVVLGLGEVLTPGGLIRYFGFLQIYDRETITGGIGPAWTLCIEVTFYLALPLWALLARRLPGRFLTGELVGLAAIVALSLIWKALVIYVVPSDTPGWLPAQVWLPAFADHFAVGMALAVISVARPESMAALDRAPWLPWALAAAAFLALGGGGSVFGIDGLWQHVLRGLLGAFLLLPAIFGDTSRGAVRRLLASPVLLWLGAISYGFYLWHLPVILELSDLADGELAAGVLAAAALAVTVTVAAASWYGVERPALRLGRLRFGRPGADEVEERVAPRTA